MIRSERSSFGELVLDDYVTALLAVLESLFESGLAPVTLVGHSQGGLLIQMAQQVLVSRGSSLWQAAGISRSPAAGPESPPQR
jgi:triacylglycerol esterase/lipase EstA (alpha/beta hydrolase family)